MTAAVLAVLVASTAGALGFVWRLVADRRAAEAARDVFAEQEQRIRTQLRRTHASERARSAFLRDASAELSARVTHLLARVDTVSGSGRVAVEADVARLRRLATELGDLARHDLHELEVHYARLDLAERVRDIAATFGSLADRRRVSLVVDTPPELWIDADPNKIERALLNVLVHLMGDASADAELCVRAFTTHAGIVSIAMVAEGVRFDDHADTRPFVELLTPAGDPLGARHLLELWIARGLVLAHGGVVHIQRDARLQADAIVMELPARAPPGVAVRQTPPPAVASELLATADLGAAVDAATARPAPDPSRPRVLVVEDSGPVRQLLGRQLGRTYDVEETSSAAEALERLHARPFDLLLTDLRLPGMTGQQLIQQLRVDPRLDALPIVVVTASTDDALRASLLREGAQDFITKPFRLEEVEARVANLIRTKRAHDVLAAGAGRGGADLEQLARRLNDKRRRLELALEQAHVARDLAERANAVKGNFLRMMSHEVKTPITAMELQLTLMTRTPSLTALPAARQATERLSSSCRQLRELVDSMLSMARLEAGILVREIDEVAMDALVADAVEPLEGQLEAKGLQLRLDVAPGTTLVTDRRLVRLVLNNLLTNALKYTQQGHIAVAARRDGDELVVVVEDTGRASRSIATARCSSRLSASRISGNPKARAPGSGSPSSGSYWSPSTAASRSTPSPAEGAASPCACRRCASRTPRAPDRAPGRHRRCRRPDLPRSPLTKERP